MASNEISDLLIDSNNDLVISTENDFTFFESKNVNILALQNLINSRKYELLNSDMNYQDFYNLLFQLCTELNLNINEISIDTESLKRGTLIIKPKIKVKNTLKKSS